MVAHRRIVSLFLFLVASVHTRFAVAGPPPEIPDSTIALAMSDDVDSPALNTKHKHQMSFAVTSVEETKHGDTTGTTHHIDHPEPAQLQTQQQPQQQQQSHTSKDERHLQQVQDVGRLFSDFLDTPIDQWSGAQWVVLLIIVIVVSALCRCLCSCSRTPYYYRSSYPPGGYYGGYPGGYYGGGYYGRGSSCCSCSDLFWCLCCFEWCCRDCRDVDACCNNAANVYEGGQMV